jgi:Protein of unknown function (DUF551)
MKYRKKPVIIEAIQFNGNNHEEIISFTKGNAVHQKAVGSDEGGNGLPQLYEKLTITTIHQGQKVDLVAGDFVIPEADGVHFYPCKPDVFEKTYDSTVVDDWISVEDKLPENMEYVLCWLKSINRSVVNSYSLGADQDDKWFIKNFSHWRPLPEPPMVLTQQPIQVIQ